MKTAISVPDRLFQRAEELARRLGKTRSQVYREALTEYLARRDSASVTTALDEVADEVGAVPGEWLGAAATRTLERNEW